MRRISVGVLLTLLCVHASLADARQLRESNPGLTVVSTAPEGEVASLAEANEIRVVFSESMVSLGRIPTDVHPAFFKISPAVVGTFRWSGTHRPDLHAGSEATARVCDDLSSDDRGGHTGGKRPQARARGHVFVHDTDRPALADALVSTRRHERWTDGGVAALQSTGPSR